MHYTMFNNYYSSLLKQEVSTLCSCAACKSTFVCSGVQQSSSSAYQSLSSLQRTFLRFVFQRGLFMFVHSSLQVSVVHWPSFSCQTVWLQNVLVYGGVPGGGLNMLRFCGCRTSPDRANLNFNQNFYIFQTEKTQRIWTLICGLEYFFLKFECVHVLVTVF